MVGKPDTRPLRRVCVAVLGFVGTLACLRGATPVPMSLAEVNRRVAPSLAAAHLGEAVIVR